MNAVLTEPLHLFYYGLIELWGLFLKRRQSNFLLLDFYFFLKLAKVNAFFVVLYGSETTEGLVQQYV